MQQLCVIAFGIITWWYKRQIQTLKKATSDEKALKLAMVALLRDRFYQGYKFFIQQRFFPINDREIIQDIYDQYHALGGNGVITHLMEELKELPTYPPDAE